MSYFNRNRYSALVVLMMMFVFCLALNSYAASVTIPNTFTSGTTISSSQVNQNFSTLANAINSMSTNTIQAMVYGYITSNGTIFSGSGNFTVNRSSAGLYSIVFPTGLPNKTPACTVSSAYGINLSPPRLCGFTDMAPDGLIVNCVQWSVSGTAILSTATDLSFNFICIF